MANPGSLLRSRSLRKTQVRTSILQLMMENKIAMSERELEKLLNNQCDRVTIYRTLHTFLEKGLVHKVLDGQGSTKYALCHHDCSAEGEHHHDHVHFRCTHCEETTCLEHVSIPHVNLPQGYQAAEVNLLFEGLCPKCRQ